MIHSYMNGDVLKTSDAHNHVDKVPDVQLDALETQCKRKAAECISKSPFLQQRQDQTCIRC